MSNFINFTFFVIGWLMVTIGICVAQFYWSPALGLTVGGAAAMGFSVFDYYRSKEEG